MLYSAILDRKIEDHTFPTLQEAFVDLAFNQFMDNGRCGFNFIALDIVDNFEVLLRRTSQRPDLSDFQRKQLALSIRKFLMDGFIKHGSEGLKDAIASAFNLIIHVRTHGESA